MNLKVILRICSLIMLIVAVIFLAYALTHPEAGTVFYIGTLRIGAELWRVFYLIYLAVMVALFGASFFVKNNKTDKKDKK